MWEERFQGVALRVVQRNRSRIAEAALEHAWIEGDLVKEEGIMLVAQRRDNGCADQMFVWEC